MKQQIDCGEEIGKKLCEQYKFSTPPYTLYERLCWIKGRGPRCMLSLFYQKKIMPFNSNIKYKTMLW